MVPPPATTLPLLRYLKASLPPGYNTLVTLLAPVQIKPGRYLGVSTMPSYSLLWIISSVCMKCFLLASTDAESCWLPARLEWMSSMRPLRYLVVTYQKRETLSLATAEIGVRCAYGMRQTYRLVLLVKVVNISVEDLDKQLDGRGRLHA